MADRPVFTTRPLTPADLKQAARLWKRGADTNAIAAELFVPEFLVYAHLADIKAFAPEVDR